MTQPKPVRCECRMEGKTLVVCPIHLAQGYHTILDSKVHLNVYSPLHPVPSSEGERDFKVALEEKLDEMFPKGKCKERGAALVLFSEAVWLHRSLLATAERKTNEELARHAVRANEALKDAYQRGYEEGQNTAIINAVDMSMAGWVDQGRAEGFQSAIERGLKLLGEPSKLVESDFEHGFEDAKDEFRAILRSLSLEPKEK